MLDGLKRDDYVDGCIFQRKIGRIAEQEAQIFEIVRFSGMGDRALVKIHSDNT